MADKKEIKVQIDISLLEKLQPYLSKLGSIEEYLSNVCNHALALEYITRQKTEAITSLQKMGNALNKAEKYFSFMDACCFPSNADSFIHFHDFTMMDIDRRRLLSRYPAKDSFVGGPSYFTDFHERIFNCLHITLIFDPETETIEFADYLDKLKDDLYNDGKQRTPCDKIKNLQPSECRWLDPDEKRPRSYKRTNITVFPICMECNKDCVVRDIIKDELDKIGEKEDFNPFVRKRNP